MPNALHAPHIAMETGEKSLPVGVKVPAWGIDPGLLPHSGVNLVNEQEPRVTVQVSVLFNLHQVLFGIWDPGSRYGFVDPVLSTIDLHADVVEIMVSVINRVIELHVVPRVRPPFLTWQIVLMEPVFVDVVPNVPGTGCVVTLDTEMVLPIADDHAGV